MDLQNRNIFGLFSFIFLFYITFTNQRAAAAVDNDAELLKYRNSYPIITGVPPLRDVYGSRRYKRGVIDFDPGNRATHTASSTTTTGPPPPSPNPSLFTSATTISTVTTTTADRTNTTTELPNNATTVSQPSNTTLTGSTTPPSNTTSTGNKLTNQATLCFMSTCILICNFVL